MLLRYTLRLVSASPPNPTWPTPWSTKEGTCGLLWTYTETAGGPTREAVVKSMLPVRAEVSTGPDESPAANGSPDFEDDTDTRTVAENLDCSTRPWATPFRAIEPDREDVLTYSIHPVADVVANTNDTGSSRM